VPSLEQLGAGVIVAWLALPVLVRAARPRAQHDPAAAYRHGFAALLLAAACSSLPWLRSQLPRLTDSLTPLALSVQVSATPVGGHQSGAFRGYSVSPFDLLSLVWMLACLTAGVRWAVARARLSGLLRRSRPAPNALQRRVTELARARGIAPPRLLLSDEALAPFSVGAFSPSVVLPAALVDELPPERLELILQHELAHVRRRDPLTHALTRLGTTLFAFHPSVPGLLRELTIAREAAVDAEIAVHDRHAYASLLLHMASRVRFGHDTLHVAMDDTALARRIALLTESAPARRRHSAAPLLAAAAAIAGLGLLAPRVFADPAHFHATPLGVFADPARFHAAPLGVFGEPARFQFAPVGLGDPMAPHEAEIDRCYALARAEKPQLVISAPARFEVDPVTFRVTAADVRAPESPTFQSCVERAAMTWSFPPPPGFPPPPRDTPPGAEAMVATHIEREP
jgi:beta-lactamase regulating signal transducer with metallopeptidase domain